MGYTLTLLFTLAGSIAVIIFDWKKALNLNKCDVT